MSPHRWAPALIVGVALATPARAGSLTYAAALQRAISTAPGIEASRLGVEAARASVGPAGALPDPKLGLSLDNFPVTGREAGRLGVDNMTMERVGVTQDVPNAGRRRAATASARAAVSQADANRLAEVRKVKIATAVAWIDLAYAERRLAAMDEVLARLAPLWKAQPAAVASGRERPGQALAPVQMQARLEDERSELAAAVGRARAELTRWTGEPAPEAVGEPPHYAIDAAALHAAIPDNPTLLVSRSAVQRAQAEVDAARAAKRPDWSWDVAYERRDPRFGDMVSAGVTISLPLFAKRRQDPLIDASIASEGGAIARREDVRRGLKADLESGLADHVMHHEQWTRANGTLLPLARQRVDLEIVSYSSGRATLLDLIQAQSQFVDAGLLALEREALVARDGARLVLTYGGDR
jgi:outer membrane protein TolC